MAAKKQRDIEEKQPKASQFNRHPALYIGSVIILVIVVVTFVGGPIASGAGGQGKIVFGEYNGEEIAYVPGNYFARQYEAIANQVRSSGDNTNLQMQLRLIWREAFNRTVFHTAVTQRAEAAGMRVTEERVDRAIAQMPQFQEQGRFSAERYRNTPSQERFALRRFIEESLMYERVVQDVVQGTEVSEAEIAFFRSMAGPERRFSFVSIPFSEFPEEELATYAEENQELFRSVQLSVITTRGSQEEAQEIRRQAVERESSFEDLAREHSTGALAEQGGDMGRVFAYELERDLTQPEDVESVLDTEEGEISPVLETPTGWAIYRVNSGVREFDPADPQNLEAVRSYMNTFQRGYIEDFVREQAASFAEAARQSSFSEAAAEEELDVAETGFFPINYGDAPYFSQLNQGEGQEIAEAAQTERFFLEGFSLRQGEVSEPIVLRRSVVVLQLQEEREVSSEDTEFLVDYYPYLVQQNQSQQVRLSFVRDEELEDNFAATFGRYIVGTPGE
jgi:hypothetical protein